MPKNPKSKIWFDLTYEQAEALDPLFIKAYEAGRKGNPGMIILQPRGSAVVHGDFIPEKYAVRIIEILKEFANGQPNS